MRLADYLIRKKLKKLSGQVQAVLGQNAEMLAALQLLITFGETMSQQLDALKAQVETNKNLTKSAIQLIQGLAAKIEELKDDPVALQALADDMRAQDDDLAAALQANTPTPPSP